MGRICSYLGILLLTFIFTYIFNVKENNVLLIMLLIMPVLDCISFIFFKMSTSAELEINNDTVEKGQRVFCTIKLINKGILPIPFIDYSLLSNGKIKVNADIYERRSLGIREIYEKSETLAAVHIGLGEIKLDDIVIRSLFGLFKGKVKCNEISKKIAIVPRVPNIEGIDMLMESSEASDDEDSSSLIQGEPGYDYKDYMPGDPLSRVNWKLSSKRNKLVIRKSLAMGKCKKIIVLDNHIISNKNFDDISDLLSEAVLGIANELYLADYEVDVFIKNGGRWKDTSVNNVSDIEELQIYFSTYIFSYDIGRLEGLRIYDDNKYDVILVTSNKDEEISIFLRSIQDKCNSVEIISNNRTKLMDEEFYIGTDYELGRL